MLKRLAALGLTVFALGSAATHTSAYTVSRSDESEAARIQRIATKQGRARTRNENRNRNRNENRNRNRNRNENRNRNSNYTKMARVKKLIESNEKEIKGLEKRRSKLDHDLAVKMQIRENTNGAWERYKLSLDIDEISKKIDTNEKHIKALKEKRSRLDHEYAVLLQLKEV